MSTHPVTLFTGQWADLPFEEVARLASSWGYDGLEIAASGDHLDLRGGRWHPGEYRLPVQLPDVAGRGEMEWRKGLVGPAEKPECSPSRS